MSNKVISIQARENEWQGKGGKAGTIAEAKKFSREFAAVGDMRNAHLILVSPYYSAIKRNALLAPWRLAKATRASYAAQAYGGSFLEFSVAELNVLASPLALYPRWWGRNLERARALIYAALDPKHPDNIHRIVVPHDQALNLCLYGRILKSLHPNLSEGSYSLAIMNAYQAAEQLLPAIDREGTLIAQRQKVRVMHDVGSYRWRFGSVAGFPREYQRGKRLLHEALVLAEELVVGEDGKSAPLSAEQAGKIRKTILQLSALRMPA